MSLKYEQYRSLKYTREFLRDLLNHDTRPKTVKELKERSLRCLRHFPALAEDGRPYFSVDTFKDPYFNDNKSPLISTT